MKKIVCLCAIMLCSLSFAFTQNRKTVSQKNKIRIYSGYLDKIEVGDRGVYFIFKDINGKERIFRQDPYTPLIYFLVSHKGQLANISYKIKKILVPNASDGWKINQVDEYELFVSAKVGGLTNSIWWEEVKKQAIKDAKGNKAEANKKLKNHYEALVNKLAN